MHGGIPEAISAGLLPGSLTTSGNSKKDYATLYFLPSTTDVQIKHGDITFTAKVIGALNWLGENGYNKRKSDMDFGCGQGAKVFKGETVFM